MKCRQITGRAIIYSLGFLVALPHWAVLAAGKAHDIYEAIRGTPDALKPRA